MIRSPRASTGFTIVELVLVLTLMSTLSWVAVRFFSQSGFDADFSYERVRVALDYARKLAIASGCPIEVDLSSASVFSLNRTAGCDDTQSFGPLVKRPSNGVDDYAQTLPARITIDAPDVSRIVFDPLGRIRDADNRDGDNHPTLVTTDPVRVRILLNGVVYRKLSASPELGSFLKS